MIRDQISVEEALSLVEALQTEAAGEVAAALRLLAREEVFPLAETDVAALMRIYQRRTARCPDVVGGRDLIVALETYNNSTALIVAIPTCESMNYIWFDDELKGVLGCVTGTDRRDDAS